MELIDERPFDFGNMDVIPYLADEDSLMAPKHHRMAKMTAEESSWPDSSDIYDFIPDNNDLLSLHGSLPLAEEVIVPLDWEEGKMNRNSEKRNVFMSRGWKAGGHRDAEPQKAEKGSGKQFNVHYTPFGTINWIPGKRKPDRETESEEKKDESTEEAGNTGKKNVFVSSSWVPSGRLATGHNRRPLAEEQSEGDPSIRISSQESWSLPRQYWSVPHLFASHWQ